MIKSILDEISELSGIFQSFSIVFARREANQVAHCCAKYATIQDESFTWDADPPDFLVHSLQADCNSVIGEQQVSDALFSLPGYLRGLEGF